MERIKCRRFAGRWRSLLRAFANGEKAVCEKNGVAAVNFHSGEKKVLNLVPSLSGGMFM